MLAIRNPSNTRQQQQQQQRKRDNSNHTPNRRRQYSYRHLQQLPVNVADDNNHSSNTFQNNDKNDTDGDNHTINHQNTPMVTTDSSQTQNQNISTKKSSRGSQKSNENTTNSSAKIMKKKKSITLNRSGKSKKRELLSNNNSSSNSGNSGNNNNGSSSSSSTQPNNMTLRPIQTSDLGEEHNHLLGSETPSDGIRSSARNTSKKTKTPNTNTTTSQLKHQLKSNNNRQRSISPHARAMLSRTFSRSRSRSRSRSTLARRLLDENEEDDSSSIGSSSSASSYNSSHNNTNDKQLLVAVLSCRSDAYITQKAPGSASMLPRKAPSALKTFHELAVGVKDAYESMGAMPVKMDENSEEFKSMSKGEQEGRKILFEFMGNLNFLLALVDEVATDSATRGALKDDIAFKNLRDVIKKCNKVLERMLIRRDNKYTLFFRLVQPHDTKDILKMQVWNKKVELAVTALSANDEYNNGGAAAGHGSNDNDAAATDDVSEVGSVTSESSRGSIMSRGRAMLRTAGRVRTRRATPTPRMRNKSVREGNSSFASMADDGYARSTPVTTTNLNKLQLSFNNEDKTPAHTSSSAISDLLQKKKQSQMADSNNGLDNSDNNRMMLAPKDELVGMIRDLKQEKTVNENQQIQQPWDIKPNWLPKADIPTTVPILPVEYIHRHRLMKQVVNSLINCSDSDEKESKAHIITSITSRHADKAGNGKTTLAAAAVQSVEVRERFSDGIAWIQLGRRPLSDTDVKRLYEEIYDQLLKRDFDVDENNKSPHVKESKDDNTGENSIRASAKQKNGVAHSSSNNRRNFQVSELQSMKEDLGRILTKRRVLICLDDVWRLEDAERFMFESVDIVNSGESNSLKNASTYPHRLLITTRSPGLFSQDEATEVFVRIFSEHEAVKLLLYAAGRRLHGGKSAPAFNQARVIVKGCGNSPLALRLAGGMLRTSNRNWTLSSPVWTSLVEQCRASLEEASKIRSFVNSVGRIVDMSFMVVPDLKLRTTLRRCFVTFAMVFHDNEWLLTGKGIPRGIVEKLFQNVISRMNLEPDDEQISSDYVIGMLEHMNLLHRARHGTTAKSSRDNFSISSSSGKSLLNGSITSSSEDSSEYEAEEISETDESVMHVEHTSFLMHESIKYIAEDMSSRSSISFSPKDDEYTVFREQIVVEDEMYKDTKGQSWLKNAAKYLFSPLDNNASADATQKQFHGLMVCVLKDNKELNDEKILRGLNVEKYVVSNMPIHLIRAQMFESASSILLDFKFIDRRIQVLGVLEAAKRHMGDLTMLREEVQKKSKEDKENTAAVERDENVEESIDLTHLNSSSTDARNIDSKSSHDESSSSDIDVTRTQREACRRVLDAIRRSEFQSSTSETSINVAVCLATVSEFLLKARIIRDAIARSEEALQLFQNILGEGHVEVARALNSLAKACIKAGDERLALLKLYEAQRIFESSDSLNCHDAISNNTLIATLLVESGDWENATVKYEEVISMKQKVYGHNSVIVAKTMNDYAIVLAKHSRMSESLRQYEAARDVYININRCEKFSFDVTLIELNIASIKSKLGNYQGALESYERGVKGLRLQIEKEKGQIEGDTSSRLAAQKRHLISAMGRIGSMRMKLKDNAGALKAYLTLIKEVGKKSPAQSQMEKARAHVKCATIFRQTGTKDNNALAISHLSQALQMYTILHGVNHKDTKAIGSSLRQWRKMDASLDK